MMYVDYVRYECFLCTQGDKAVNHLSMFTRE